jgi:hypothetical protein
MPAVAGIRARFAVLFAQDGVAREGALNGGADVLLRSAVGHGHRRAIRLEFRLKRLVVVPQG